MTDKSDAGIVYLFALVGLVLAIMWAAWREPARECGAPYETGCPVETEVSGP